MSILDLGLWAACLAWATSGLSVGAIALAGRRLQRTPASFLTPDHRRPVTIVRPLCGLEPFSEDTLRSGFRVDYPDYELVFCVASGSDPIIPLVERLMAAYPQVCSRLLVGDDRVSDNPKLNNCVKGWEAARNDWVILADSNVLMPPHYISGLLSAWRPNSGLVCSTPIGTRPDGFWAVVECAFLNTLQARWQYAGEAVGLGFAQGKTMLWYRPLLDERGGIRALGAEIAEDAAATKIVRAAGLHVHLVDRPFEQPLGRRSAREVWARQLRWARLRRVTFPLFFVPEILSSPAVPAAAIAAGGAGAAHGLLAVAAMLLCWHGGEVWLARRAGWHLSWRLPLALLVRDILILPLWAAAILGHHVVWRGNAMRIGPQPPVALATSR